MFNLTFENYMVSQIITWPWSLVCVIAWAIVALGAAWAIFSNNIRDIVTERIALSVVSVAACSRAYYVWDIRAVSLDGLVIALALAFYVLIMWWKHHVIIPRMRAEPKRTQDFYGKR